ncbi:MAG: isochorismatase [Chloroflexi bacterium]|nr:isochorismatase [Chloroflexota bacterium]
MNAVNFRELPLPPHYDPARAGEIWPAPYQERARAAQAWARQHHLQPAAADQVKLALIAIDVQNSFCIPGFELFVGGRSGLGAVEDNRRLCEFIYRNLGSLAQITATLDTHTAMQIFHPVCLVDAQGEHPAPLTQVSYEDIEQGRWRFNPQVAASLGIDPDYGQQHLLHYARTLHARGKYDLTIWPYHVMLGSLGHALVPAVEEAIFFHTIARSSQADFDLKGDQPLTEHYSVIGPEVMEGPDGRPLSGRSSKFLERLLKFDAVIIAGQAKSHCVAWTIDDLLNDIRRQDERLVEKVYLLEDCTSPVVVPGVVDYTAAADQAFARFAAAGMHVVRSTAPLSTWPGM